MAREQLGTATTDSRGIAVLSNAYTGSASGKIDFSARVTINGISVDSPIYTVNDCYFKCIGNEDVAHNGFTKTSQITAELTDEGTKLSKVANNNTQQNYKCDTGVDGDFEAIVTGKSLSTIRIGVMDTNSARQHVNFYNLEWSTVKIRRVNNVLTFYIDDVETAYASSGTLDTSDTLYLVFYIYNPNGDTEFVFKDVQIYPI